MIASHRINSPGVGGHLSQTPGDLSKSLGPSGGGVCHHRHVHSHVPGVAAPFNHQLRRPQGRAGQWCTHKETGSSANRQVTDKRKEADNKGISTLVASNKAGRRECESSRREEIAPKTPRGLLYTYNGEEGREERLIFFHLSANLWCKFTHSLRRADATHERAHYATSCSSCLLLTVANISWLPEVLGEGDPRVDGSLTGGHGHVGRVGHEGGSLHDADLLTVHVDRQLGELVQHLSVPRTRNIKKKKHNHKNEHERVREERWHGTTVR